MIPVLVPDLPTTEELLPWLRRIEHNKWYTNFGPLVQEFESQLIKLFTQENKGHLKRNLYLTTVSSGTTALELALLALNLPAGCHALLPAFTFPATAIAIKRSGIQPIFTDVDPQQWLLTPKIARQVLEKKPYDVVIPVATFGCPQPVEEWDKFNEETGIPVLIDAAAAFGTQSIGERCIITFSFHATKPFGIGEGGLVVANRFDFIDQVRKLSNFGFDCGTITQSGSNAKLSEYHAAVALAQLKRWTQIIERREKIWEIYRRNLSVMENKISLQKVPSDYIRATLSIKINSINTHLEQLIEQLTHQGIQTRRWYYPPLFKFPAFRDAVRISPDGCNDLVVTQKLSQCLLGLPFHTSLKEETIAFICRHLRI